MISRLQITSGQGPDECAWVVGRVLNSMQTEAQEAGQSFRLVEAIPGSKPGAFKSVLVSLEGEMTQAFIDAWQGTIQWVGKSPFRPHHKRQNWYVGVKAFSPPQKTEWQPDEIRIDRMRSSGPGGQHANKTESAVRITHLPSGTSVVAQEERSQHLNRKLAFSRLSDSLKRADSQATQQKHKDRWICHITLERGNPIRVYQGKDFKRKQ